MEKQTRMSKYKDLRSEMMEEVSIHHTKQVSVEEDDDFLAFIPKKKEVTIEDTLQQPLTYETLDKNDEGTVTFYTLTKIVSNGNNNAWAIADWTNVSGGSVEVAISRNNGATYTVLANDTLTSYYSAFWLPQ